MSGSKFLIKRILCFLTKVRKDRKTKQNKNKKPFLKKGGLRTAQEILARGGPIGVPSESELEIESNETWPVYRS